MMNWKKMMLTAVAVLGSVGLAAASPVTITFTNSYSGLGGPTQGVYYYPYFLQVNGGGQISVVCDDYYNNTYVKNPGESWLATVNTFTDAQGTGLTGGLFLNAPPTGYATYNNISTLQAYREAAWLDQQFTNPTIPGVNSNDWAAINFALWDLFDANAQTLNASSPLDMTSSVFWLNQAGSADLTNFDFSNFVIYTPLSGWPSNDGTPQEFISEVPEPATLLLLLGGLACLAGWEWRRRQLVTG
ncbi:MAG: PEP-CTERM sorting domain-containing protein [Terriglobales bacterium]